MFRARPKIDLHIVPVPNFLCQNKRCFVQALHAISFLVGPKQIGPAQKVLELVEGHDICLEYKFGIFHQKLKLAQDSEFELTFYKSS